MLTATVHFPKDATNAQISDTLDQMKFEGANRTAMFMLIKKGIAEIAEGTVFELVVNFTP
jgi:hypothetical protein